MVDMLGGRGIPEAQLNYPWESCIPLSNDWGWVPDAPYKSAQKVINLLIEITAKGGCLALGIGPTADGIIEKAVVTRLNKIGEWLNTNGKAIYNTRTPRFTTMETSGSPPTKTAKPFTPSMHCRKEKNFLTLSNGQETYRQAKSLCLIGTAK